MDTEIPEAKKVWEAIYALNRALDNFEVDSDDWVTLSEARNNVWAVGRTNWPHAFMS